MQTTSTSVTGGPSVPVTLTTTVHRDASQFPYWPVGVTWDHGRIKTTRQNTRPAVMLDYDPTDGYLSAVTSNDGDRDYLTKYQRDPMGRALLQSLPNAELNTLGRTAMSYDGEGNLTFLTPPGHKALPAVDASPHGLTYTSLGQIEWYKPPAVPLLAAKDTKYEYNTDRQPLKITLPGTRVITFTYDDTVKKTGRLKTVTLPTGEGAIDLTYANGHVATVSGPTNETVTFDRNGMLSTSMTSTGDVAGSVSWTHDADFRPATESINTGSSVAMLYDGDGLPTCIGGCTLVNDSVMRTGDVLEIDREDAARKVTTELGHVTSNVWDGIPHVSTTAIASAYAELSTYEANHIASDGTATPLYAVTYGRDDLGRITSKN